MINVNLIRAFTGPRHEKLERVWAAISNLCADEANVYVFDNLGAKLSHAQAYNEIWKQEVERPEPYTLFTEFDFLPSKRWLSLDGLDAAHPVVAATYVTRSPSSREIIKYGFPGAWYILVDKQGLRIQPGVGTGAGQPLHLQFDPAGPCNDPANGLADYLRRAGGLKCFLLPTEDCYPRHYGVEVVGRGEHLFWSRHYNDPGHLRVAGFGLGDIQQKIDAAIAAYSSKLLA